MRRVVHRSVGGKRRSSTARRVTAPTGGTGFGRLLAQLFSAADSLERSRTRVGR